MARLASGTSEALYLGIGWRGFRLQHSCCGVHRQTLMLGERCTSQDPETTLGASVHLVRGKLTLESGHWARHSSSAPLERKPERELAPKASCPSSYHSRTPNSKRWRKNHTYISRGPPTLARLATTLIDSISLPPDSTFSLRLYSNALRRSLLISPFAKGILQLEEQRKEKADQEACSLVCEQFRWTKSRRPFAVNALAMDAHERSAYYADLISAPKLQS